MGSLRLWAIGIDEAREIFSASPELAERLRVVAEQRFGTALPRPRGLLGKLGPLVRGSHDPAAPRPGVPGAEDVDDLLAGRFVPPQRLASAWNLVECWFSELAWGAGEWTLSESELKDLDFALAAAHVPSRYGLSDLFKAGLGLSLQPCAGLASGFVGGEHARAMERAWTEGLPELEPRHRMLAGEVTGFLGHGNQWAADAASDGRPEPDLVAIFRV